MADFTYNPDFNYKVTPAYSVLRSQMENGVELRRLVHANKLRRYQLVFNSRTTTEMDAVKTFFDSKKGSLTSFTISIEGADVRGVFQEESFIYSRTGPNSWSYEFTLDEVVS